MSIKDSIVNAMVDFTGSVRKNAPLILTVTSIVGSVSAVGMAIKNGDRTKNDISKAKTVYIKKIHKDESELETKEKAGLIFAETKAAIPSLWPIVVMEGVSIASALGSYKISAKRTAAYATLYAMSAESLKDYQAKVKEKFGEKKEQEVRDEIAQDKVNENPPTEAELAYADDEMLCYDKVSGRYFKSTVEDIMQAQNRITKILYTEDYASLNDFYYEIGLSPIGIGDYVGWNVRSDITLSISFTSGKTKNNVPYLVINYDYDDKFRDM